MTITPTWLAVPHDVRATDGLTQSSCSFLSRQPQGDGQLMHFQLNSDSSIQADERLAEIAEMIVLASLGNLVPRLTRVEVHLQSVSAAKGGPANIRCMIEARPEGMNPQSVTHHDVSVQASLRSGARKLRSLLDTQFGKLDER